MFWFWLLAPCTVHEKKYFCVKNHEIQNESESAKVEIWTHDGKPPAEYFNLLIYSFSSFKSSARLEIQKFYAKIWSAIRWAH